MKLQKGIVKDNSGKDLIAICEVSNPDKPEVLMAFFNSWNNTFIADHIIDLIIKSEEENVKIL